MQLHGELDAQASRVETAALTAGKRRSRKTRKVTIRLSEALHEKLQLAAERPGVGKSMMVEDALDRVLNKTTPVEDLVGERFDEMRARFDYLERDMRMMAEAVALHARYHLALMPVVPESRQQEAILLGDERFKVLAEQVDRRVRLGQPLLQETINRLKSENPGAPTPRAPEQRRNHSTPSVADSQHGPDVPVQSSRNGSADTRGALPADRRRSEEQKRSRQTEGKSVPDEANTSDVSVRQPHSKWRLTFSIFLPFAAGYFLSFLFRTINGSISPALATEFGLDAAQTGLLASVYFLVFAAAQIPIGILLDRYGPRLVHSVLLILAVGGATLFGAAEGYVELLIGRAMIGLGVSAALMAGLKAIVIWFPKERTAFVNGWMIMLGSLGAVTATAPTDWLLNSIGWRGLFEILTIATLATSALIYFFVPKDDLSSELSSASEKPLTLRAVLSDPRFLRMAPLSATCIGTSWALQSLWAASWLADVEGFDRPSLVRQLFAMAIAISIGALLLGTAADRLGKRGFATGVLLAAVGALSVLAESVLVLRLPLPSIVPWATIAVTGAATVLSYAMIAEYFPKGVAARANGALNLLHFGWAFIAQCGIGLIVGQWPAQDGHYPVAAYQYAFAVSLAVQILALAWFIIPWLRALYWRRTSDQLEADEVAINSTAQPGQWVLTGAYANDGPEW